MAKSTRDTRYALSRRRLIRWSVATGAALGLPRWKIFEVLERSGGVALAADAACHPTNRSVHIVAGDGGFAWFQLLWPHNAVAAAGNPNFSFHAPGEQTMAAGTDRPLTLGPEAPWKTLAGRRQVSAFMTGINETHTKNPMSAASLGGNSLYAIAAALQTSNPSVIPVVSMGLSINGGPVTFGTAPGAPRPSEVNAADDVIGLFNSRASRDGGLLALESDAELYSAHYQALIGLNRAADRSTQAKSYETARGAARLLGSNMASALTPTDEDRARYGIGPGTRTNVAELGKSLQITARAFKLGLTSSVVIGAMRDDPHGAFNDLGALRTTTTALGKVLDGFWADLAATPDEGCGGKSLADNVVLTIHGDTPKTPLNRDGWGDGTPGNANWMYVLGNGYLKSGWHGGILANGAAQAFDPATGEANGAATSTTSAAVNAAIAYAIGKGDTRRVGDFTRGIEFGGIINPIIM